jgi:hypothetical protein
VHEAISPPRAQVDEIVGRRVQTMSPKRFV